MDNDIDYGALFGIDEGEKAQEAAEPAADAEGAQGVKEREAAGPAPDAESAQGVKEQKDAESAEDEQNDDMPRSGVDDGNGGAGNSAEGNTQSPEENGRFAAARRKAEKERDKAVRRAREEAEAHARRLIDETFRDSGLTDPYTRQPINSKEEFDAYRARHKEEQKKNLLRRAGMTDAEFDRFVAELPEVRQAKEAQAQAEEAARLAQEQQARLKVDEQLKEIAGLNPEIRQLEDLTKMETYPRFYELVRKGNSLVDAYKIANFDTLSRSAAAAGRQAAVNAAQSKQHLGQTTARGAGAVSVPAEIKEEYRAFNPGATDAEIQQHYNRYLKR